MSKEKQNKETNFTFYVPFSWMELILNEELLPLGEEYLDKEEFSIMGWDILFSTEDSILNLYLYDANEAMQTGDILDEDRFMDFSIDDITSGVWKSDKIGNETIRIRCLWIK